MRREILALFLALSLALALATPAAAATKFTDVPADAWYAADVSDVQKYGIIQGVGKNQFRPSGTLTFAQAVTMAARAYEYLYGDENKYPESGAWYDPYVSYAIDTGILAPSAVPEDAADYNKPCSRATMATLFYRTLSRGNNATLNNVTAIPDVPNDIKGHDIYALYNYGILAGSDKYGTFHPDKSISRAETAAILNRVLNTDKRKTFTLVVALTPTTPATTPTTTTPPKTTPTTTTPTTAPAKPAPTPTTTPSNTTSATYILNTNSKKFHLPSCASVNKMSPKNKATFTGTRDEVIAKGYEPCKNCKP